MIRLGAIVDLRGFRSKHALVFRRGLLTFTPRRLRLWRRYGLYRLRLGRFRDGDHRLWFWRRPSRLLMPCVHGRGISRRRRARRSSRELRLWQRLGGRRGLGLLRSALRQSQVLNGRPGRLRNGWDLRLHGLRRLRLAVRVCLSRRLGSGRKVLNRSWPLRRRRLGRSFRRQRIGIGRRRRRRSPPPYRSGRASLPSFADRRSYSAPALSSSERRAKDRS